jgi:hypothetical protein
MENIKQKSHNNIYILQYSSDIYNKKDQIYDFVEKLESLENLDHHWFSINTFQVILFVK